ncbi:unnamed protein product [Pichia kudriavzevii]
MISVGKCICFCILIIQCAFTNAIEINEGFSLPSFDPQMKDTKVQIMDELYNNTQGETWPNLSRSRAVAIRTQRDVSQNESIGYGVGAGVSLRDVVFEPFGYNQTGLANLRTLLNVGVKTLVLDLFYNEGNGKWLVCPKKKVLQQRDKNVPDECLVNSFNLTSVVNTLSDYILATNNNLNFNTLFLLLRLNAISFPTNVTVPASLINSGVQDLSIIAQIPNVALPYLIDTTKLPSLEYLLSKTRSRLFPIIIENKTPFNETDLPVSDDQLFVSSTIESLNSPDDTNVLDISFTHFSRSNCTRLEDGPNPNLISFSYDSSYLPFNLSTYRESIICGHNPIISTPFKNLVDISVFLEFSLWSWAPLQPTPILFDELSDPGLVYNITVIRSWLDGNNNLSTTPDIGSESPFVSSWGDVNSANSSGSDTSSNSNLNVNDGNDDDNNSDNSYINRCAVLSRVGWVATSCERSFRTICQNTRNLSDYWISQEKKSYVRSIKTCEQLDGDYTMVLPKTYFEQSHLIEMMPKDQLFLWINLNSMSTENCWVVGLTATCPYQEVVSRHIFAQMISPSAAMAWMLITIFILFQFRRLPVHKNRKHWKKLLNEKLKGDLDGVPS